MARICATVGGGIGKEISALWEEFESGETDEAKTLKDMDKFEMVLQANEYEAAQGMDLPDFFRTTRGVFVTPLFKALDAELRHRRACRRSANLTSEEPPEKRPRVQTAEEKVPTAEAGASNAFGPVRIPFLDFAPEFIDPILSGAKAATARCPGGQKDTDVTSDFEAIVSQGWALAYCTTRGSKAFAVLKVERVEKRGLEEIDDALAKVEGMETGDELKAAVQRFYPLIAAGDEVSVLYFSVLHRL